MSTINTKNNMYGIAGLLDSEQINIKANDRMFIDPNTRADACNERLKALKQRQLQLAPYAKSEESDDQQDEDSAGEIEFEHHSSGSTKTGANSFQSSRVSSAKSSRSSRRSRGTKHVQPIRTVIASQSAVVKSIEPRMPSEVSARQFQNNPFAIQCMRSDLLDDIYELKQQLIDEGVNIDNLQIPNVDQAPDIETLRLIKGILLRKTRKLQSNSIVEDVLFMALKGVEQVFDGKTELFGAKPNLKGLTKALTLKFRNQRQHFSGLLEEVCDKYGIGPNSKLIAQMAISSVKRAIINRDQTEDHSQNVKQLQTMYHNAQR